MVSQETKDAVMRELCIVARAAKLAGKSPYRAIEEKFPGTPEMVVIDAVVMVDIEDDAKWWEMVETTINGELVAKGIASAKGGTQ